jgi:hypothetical protein
MAEERRKDRRRGYSFRQHFKRFKVEGRLKHISVPMAAVLLVAAVTFGRCDSSSITGPSAETEQTATSPTPGPTTSTASGGLEGGALRLVKKTIGRFPSNLLSMIHPCKPDKTFTKRDGRMEVEFEDEEELDENGKRTGKHKTKYWTHAYQDDEDDEGNRYHGERRSPSVVITWSVSYRTQVSSFIFVRNSEAKGWCVQTTTDVGGQTTRGNVCDYTLGSEFNPLTADLFFFQCVQEGPSGLPETTVCLTVNPTYLPSLCPTGSLTTATPHENRLFALRDAGSLLALRL